MRTRNRALHAAQALFAAEGVDALTHLRVAAAAGVGRRTLYRHWPDRRSLLHDAFAATRAPDPELAGDLRTALLTHLCALDAALTRGPLARIVATLAERAGYDPDLAVLRTELVERGCAPLRARLARAVAEGDLPPRLDLDATVAALEGPLFHRALLHGDATGDRAVADVVDRVLAHPPETARRRA